jgi:hypothetical protein
MRCGYKPFRLTAALRKLIPEGRLPITAGHIHLMRKVDSQGTISLLNETWSVGKKWMGEYIWSVIDTLAQTLTFWHLGAFRKKIIRKCDRLQHPRKVEQAHGTDRSTESGVG